MSLTLENKYARSTESLEISKEGDFIKFTTSNWQTEEDIEIPIDRVDEIIKYLKEMIWYEREIF